MRWWTLKEAESFLNFSWCLMLKVVLYWCCQYSEHICLSSANIILSRADCSQCEMCQPGPWWCPTWDLVIFFSKKIGKLISILYSALTVFLYLINIKRRMNVLTRQLMDLFISLTKQNMTCHYFDFFLLNISFTTSQMWLFTALHGATHLISLQMLDN